MITPLNGTDGTRGTDGTGGLTPPGIKGADRAVREVLLIAPKKGSENKKPRGVGGFDPESSEKPRNRRGSHRRISQLIFL